VFGNHGCDGRVKTTISKSNFWAIHFEIRIGYENKFRVEMVVGYLNSLRSRTAYLQFFSLFKKNSSRKLFKMVIAWKFAILSLLFNHFKIQIERFNVIFSKILEWCQALAVTV
jgi:hypothetical protein